MFENVKYMHKIVYKMSYHSLKEQILKPWQLSGFESIHLSKIQNERHQ
jgi:hypothetical protein